MPINRKTKRFISFYNTKNQSTVVSCYYSWENVLPDLINIISLVTIAYYNGEYFILIVYYSTNKVYRLHKRYMYQF